MDAGTLLPSGLGLDRGGAHTSLFNAAALGLLDRVRAHLATEPSPAQVTSAFWAACHRGHLHTAEYLLHRGADLNWSHPGTD